MEIGKERIFLKTVDSTNSYALSLAEKGYPHGTVVVADAQTKGKGRHGRTWHSPRGKNIYMSIILRKLLKGSVSLLTLMAAVAVSEAIMKKAPVPLRVKWPNDLMVSDDNGFKKVGGILSEARFSGGNLEFAIIGIGINVNLLRDDLSPEIVDSATSLRIALGKDFDRNELLENILSSFDRWYGFLLEGKKREILQRWRTLSLTLGKEVKAITGEGVLEGVAMDIDEEGRLLLRLPSDKIEKISAADLVHLR